MEKYIDLTKKMDDEKIRQAAKIIKEGGIVVFPTETVYGIGTNGLDKSAIEKLYKVKKRPFDKPISLLVSDTEMINKVAKDITQLEQKLIEAFFPGPFTIILKKKEIVPDILTSNGKTVGIRMPENEIARKLVEYAGVPIAAPSANISGKKSGTNLEEILEDFDENVDCFIDGGNSKLKIGSTIVKVEDENINILRQGSISKEQIEKVIGFTLNIN